ncbi:retrovirus-related pol polyprotein from transposon TNT 1-94 [Tanacetum coccineum]|uniref:Retrovirus-related pol polyprotein from transposon TNT 1-94 n=1 Tax=Tanacetum coccineum TaxID=301880 RepID=A0ABQ5DXK5_9ASTR
MTTLAEHIIVAGAENRPLMLEKSMYDSWASRIRLFIKGKKHDDCDVQETNIIIHGLPPDVYELVNHQEAAKDIWDKVKLQMKGTELSYQERECRLGIATTSRGNYAASQPRVVKCYTCQGEGHMARQCTQPKRPRNSAWFKEKLMLVEAKKAGQILGEEQLAFIADPGIDEALVAHCDSDVLSEVPYSDTYPNDMLNQDVQEMTYSEQTHIVDFLDNEINKQAFWLKHSNYNPDTFVKSHTPVRIEAPSELPKLSIDNDQLLNQIMSQEIVHIAVNSVDILYVNKSCVYECNKCLELETGLLKKKDFIEKDVYDKLVKSYSTLEKHCISLELATQLNQEIFQKHNSGENQNAPTFNQLFEINELKAQSQEKNTIIRKLKDRIKSLSGKESVEKVTKDIDEIETMNIELENSVAKLLSENENLRKEREHLKSIFKDQFDSIKKTRVRSKEHSDSLIAQINAKSVENSDINAQLQEMFFAVAALKNE